uniref:Uncharacterized protein n=1 Tax=Megaselia scalaris TaxID=36166 RepID=T1GHE9_MEGSC
MISKTSRIIGPIFTIEDYDFVAGKNFMYLGSEVISVKGGYSFANRHFPRIYEYLHKNQQLETVNNILLLAGFCRGIITSGYICYENKNQLDHLVIY